MKMKFKYIAIFLILICCLMGAASAAEDVSADVVDVADDSVAVDAVSDDVSDSLESVDDEAVVDESAPAQDDNDDVELEASVDDEPALDEVDDELSGQSHILEEENTIHIVTNETFYNYFDEENGTLKDIVHDGDTLDFQGKVIDIEVDEYNIIINKPINIISSTNDGYVSLHTTNGNMFGDKPGNRFSITNEGSYTNVTGIYFYNTQLWLTNTHHVTLDNISAVVNEAPVGSGVGQTSIRDNSTYVTVKNSYFFTKDNGGSSSLVLGWADYCTLDNNTIEVEGTVGNMLYATRYNVYTADDSTIGNRYNKITNNKLKNNNEGDSPICWGIVIQGSDNLIENNTVEKLGGGIIDNYYNFYNQIGNNTYVNNTLNGCYLGLYRNALAINNTVLNSFMQLYYNCTAISNAILGNVTINYDNNTVDSCNITGNITFLEAFNTTIIKNNIYGIIKDISETNACSENGENSICENRIITDEKYAISFIKSTNNIIRNNYLISSNFHGDETISSEKENIVENNYPLTPIIIVEKESPNDFICYVTVLVPNSIGTVDLVMENKDVGSILLNYSDDLVDGMAEFVIDGWAWGKYDLTAYFHDTAYPIVTSNSTKICIGAEKTVFANDSTYTYNDAFEFIAYCTDEYGESLKEGDFVYFMINDVFYSVDIVEGGIAKFSSSRLTSQLPAGNYSITIGNPGTETLTKTITIQKAKTMLKTADVKMVYNNPKSFTATLTDAKGNALANKKVSIKVNGKTYVKTTDNAGKVTLSLSLAAKKYPVTISFDGDANYLKSSAKLTYKVEKANPKLIASKKTYKAKVKTKKYTITLKDNKNKALKKSKVTLKVNGKTYKATTNAKGKAIFKITKLTKKGKYNAVIKYAGNSNFKAVKKTIKLTIK